jgi:hypothetical protein
MPGVIPDAGENKLVAISVGKEAQENFTLKLFTNDYTPVEGSVAGSFTEATFTGYSAKTLTTSSWTVASAIASYAAQTFTSTAGSQNQSVYGYYIVGASSGIIIAAERFADGPYVIVNNGDSITVTPSITGS